MRILIENFDIVVEEALDIQSESQLMTRSQSQAMKDQVQFYNKSSYVLSGGEKAILLASVDSLKRLSQIQLQNLRSEQMLCSDCQSLLASMTSKSKEES